MATSLRCRVLAISAFCRSTTQTPSITNCLVAIVHTKPVNSNFSPQIGCHGNVPQHRWSPISDMIPTAHPSPQPKQHLDRFSCFCTGVPQSVPILYNGTPLLPSHGGSGPHLIRGSLRPRKSSTQTASRSVQLFLQGSLV